MLSAMLGVVDLLSASAVRHWHLAGKNGRPALVAVIADLQEVAPFLFFQRGHGKIVQHQHVDARELQQILAEAAVGARHSQFPETAPRFSCVGRRSSHRGRPCAPHARASHDFPSPVLPMKRIL